MEHELAENQYDFSNKNLRNNFIKKVYAILAFQLIVTSSFIGIVYNQSESFKEFYIKNIYIAIIAIIVEIICLYALACYKNIARKVPLNYFLLLLFTTCFSYTVSYTVCHYPKENVLIAVVLTCAATIGLTIYAFKTKTDFTMCGGLLFSCCLVLIFASIFLYFFPNKIMYIIICFMSLILYSIYLIYDTQLLMSNKKNHYSIDDYIMASMNLYIDIMQIFLNILSLLGESN